ncbi:MAG: Cache 3/Cache 2 fusion domain-containing protein, partial [Betaproteobacteria bacterium]|nr:Cache 3/Cache 2 fusion domain-containing protein [Betaproteobacteria bacterium]
MRGDLLQEKAGPALERRMGRLSAFFSGLRWNYAAMIALAFAAIVVAAAQSYRSIDKELTEAALSRNSALAKLAAVTLSEKMDRLVDIGVSLADRVRFRELIGEGKWVEASRILARVRTEFPFVDRITLNDVEGTLRADIPEVPEAMGRNFSERDWYKGVSREWKPYVSNVYRRTVGPVLNVFGVVVPIRSSDGKLLGSLLLQVRLDTLFEWTRNVDVGDEGYLYVVDRTGRVAFHPRLPLQGDFIELSAVPAVRLALAGRKGVEVTAAPGAGEESVRAYEPVRKYGWAVVAEQPAAAAFATKNQLLNRLALAYSLTALFCILAVYLASRIVTERRRAEADRRLNVELERRVAERTAQLETSNKELESFSYSISHDLRSPLRAIGGFSRILEEDYGDKLDDEARRLIGVVRENTRKMGQLIDDLLTFSRLGRKPVAATSINMEALARSALAEIGAPAAAGRARIEIHPLPEAHGDPVLIKQVWTNLLSNAIKFSGKRDQPLIEVSAHDDDADAVYCLKDNGAGFDMQYYEKLFGVFQRLHS